MSRKVIAAAKVTISDEFLKRHCFLFPGSKVYIVKQIGSYFDCLTMAGKEVRLKECEIKIVKK